MTGYLPGKDLDDAVEFGKGLFAEHAKKFTNCFFEVTDVYR